MKKIYAVATESDVVLAFESRSDADEYAGEHDDMAVLPVPCVGAYEYLRVENARLREKLDAGTEETAVQNLRKGIETAYEASRERALALTKLDECELWLGRCEPRATASPTLKGAAQDAAMPCLKAEEAHGFAMPDVNVEVKAEVTAEELAKSLREPMKPAMRMAVE